MITAGWLVLGAAAWFMLVPQVKQYVELGHLLNVMKDRLAAAQEVPSAVQETRQPDSDAPSPTEEWGFHSGAGVAALADACAAEGVTVAAYRLFRLSADGSSGVQALDLELDGPYSEVKEVLRWLEDGPFKAGIQNLRLTARDGGVHALVQAVQTVSTPSVLHTDEADLAFEPRADVFSAEAGENKNMGDEAN